MVNQAKTITHVKVLHLRKKGYGPEGKHTRNKWRKECLTNLLAGKEKFEAWQLGWLEKAKNAPSQNYEIKISYSDGSSKEIPDLDSLLSLDFSGQNLELGLIPFGSIFFVPSNFSGVTFKDITWFSCVTFKGIAKFERAVFQSHAWFNHAVFNTKANFCNATFEDIAVFDHATFEGDLWFRCASFNSESSFLSSNFNGISNFENTVFDNVGHFDGATFNGKDSKIPVFRGCKIGDTWLEFSDDNHFTQADFTEDAIKNISFLKRLADEHGQTDQALNFNAMELRAKRKHFGGRLKPVNHVDAKHLATHLSWQLWIRGSNFFSGTFWFCVFTWVYEKVSDFGRSFTKPLFWLLVLMAISFVFGWVSALCHPPKTAPQNPLYSLASCIKYPQEKDDFISISGYRAATEYSLYRAGNFLDFTDSDKNTKSVNMRLFGSEIEPWWARLFGLVKGFLTLLLLFLTGLGLRNKYRVG